jgi:hypothetical protein
MRKEIILVAFVAVLAGCSSRIPNSISPDEYRIYSDYITAHFKSDPGKLYVNTRTFSFDPLDDDPGSPCGKELRRRKGEPFSLAKQFQALGEAEYPLKLTSSGPTLRIPWKYAPVDDWKQIPDKPGTYWLVEFSRVAFNCARTRAFFAVSNVCGGECGNGGTIYAKRENGSWIFGNGYCSWVY